VAKKARDAVFFATQGRQLNFKSVLKGLRRLKRDI